MLLSLLDFNWNEIFDRYGLPTLILFVLAMVIGKVSQKVLWPFFKQQIDRANQQADAVQQVLQKQLEKSEKVQQQLMDKFSNNIEESNRLSKKLTDGIEELLRRKNKSEFS